jgi:uncharacterized protein (TIGR02271 family)
VNTTDTDQLFDYDVMDSSGTKIGSVDGVWVDDATSQPEFISVKTGFLFGKSHIMPLEQGQIDGGNRTITVPYSQDQIKDGPSFDTDATLSPQDEEQIYSFYGMSRSTATSPTGYAGGTTDTTDTGFSSDTTDTGFSSGTTDTGFSTDTTFGTDTDYTTGTADTGSYTTSGIGTNDFSTSRTDVTDETTVPLSEEELQVGKRQVERGQVRLRKVVQTDRQEIPVDLQREEIDIERVPASEATLTDVPTGAFEEQEIDVPLREEQAVVGKEARVTGAVRVGKNVQTRTETVGGDVRREDVEIDENTTDIDRTTDVTDTSDTRSF